MINYLRPDEEATYSEIERAQERDQKVKKGIKTGLSVAAAGGAGALSSRIVPFLSQYITPDLAVKGISKISPKMGDFLKRGMEMGLPIQEGLDYIKSNLEPAKENEPERSQKKPQRPINQLGQFSPELQAFVEEKIQGGKSPDHAAALAMPRAEFSDIIRKIEAQSKKKFTALVRELYEGRAVEQPQQAQGQDLSGWTKGLNPNLQHLQKQQPQQPEPSQNQGIDPKLAEIMQGLSTAIQNFKGQR